MLPPSRAPRASTPRCVGGCAFTVDARTDALVQRTIRNHFPEASVLTIAHRLNTVMDYDKVVVMQHGRVAQMGSPEELLRGERNDFDGHDGWFASMVDAGGESASAHLRELARTAGRSHK